jgi:tetratricopeptide (TPR) repeat protein
VPQEFGLYRQVLASWIKTHMVGATMWPKLTSDSADPDHLVDAASQIRTCTAFIHLAGKRNGPIPLPEQVHRLQRYLQLPENMFDKPLSVAQIEYQIARYLEKPVLTLVSAPDCCPTPIIVCETSEIQDLQASHLRVLNAAKQFSGLLDLKREVASWLRLPDYSAKPDNVSSTPLAGKPPTHQHFLTTAAARAKSYSACLYARCNGATSVQSALASLVGADALCLPQRASNLVEIKAAAAELWLKQNPGWLLILDGIIGSEKEKHANALIRTSGKFGTMLALPAIPSIPVPAEFVPGILKFSDDSIESQLRSSPELSQAAQEIADALVWFTGDPMPLEFLELVPLDVQGAFRENAVMELGNAELIRIDVGCQQFWTDSRAMRLHQESISAARAFTGLQGAVSWLNALFKAVPAVYHGSLIFFEPHVRNVLLSAERNCLIQGTGRLGVYFSKLIAGSLTQEETIASCRKALEADEKCYGAGHAEVADRLLDLSDTLGFSPHPHHREEAERIAWQAVSIKENRRGTRSLEVVNALDRLASALVSNRKIADAERVYERALTIAVDFREPPSMTVAALFNQVASFMSTQKEPEGALEFYTEARKMLVQLGAEAIYARMGLDYNLSRTLLHLGRSAEAIKTLESLIAEEERECGPDCYRAGISLDLLASVLYTEKRFDDCEPILQRALKIIETCEGAESYSVAALTGRLANLKENFGEYEKAIDLRYRSLRTLEQLPHSQGNFNSYFDVLLKLLDLLLQEHRDADAEQAAFKGIQYSNRHEDSFQKAAAVGHYAYTLYMTLQFERACTQYKYAYALMVERCGKDHQAATIFAEMIHRTANRVPPPSRRNHNG